MISNNNKTLNLPDFVREEEGNYIFSKAVTDDEVISLAKEILESKIMRHDILTGTSLAKDFCITQLSNAEDEHFMIIMLNNQHAVIGFEKLFRGTVNAAQVYPRVVVRTLLENNAAAVILTHNHPSGLLSFSDADIMITKRLNDILKEIDINLLDHILVAGGEGKSMRSEHDFFN